LKSSLNPGGLICARRCSRMSLLASLFCGGPGERRTGARRRHRGRWWQCSRGARRRACPRLLKCPRLPRPRKRGGDFPRTRIWRRGLW
jgi:hypothetical protein